VGKTKIPDTAECGHEIIFSGCIEIPASEKTFSGISIPIPALPRRSPDDGCPFITPFYGFFGSVEIILSRK